MVGWGGGGFRLKMNSASQGGGRILDLDRQRGGGLENWTIFMGVICVSSLICAEHLEFKYVKYMLFL